MLVITERSTRPMNMEPTIEINEANFELEVLKSKQPVLVEFATAWSLPSMKMDTAMDELASEYVDCLRVARVQLDRNPNLGLWYGIRCLPTFLYFSDRRRARRHVLVRSGSASRPVRMRAVPDRLQLLLRANVQYPAIPTKARLAGRRR